MYSDFNIIKYLLLNIISWVMSILAFYVLVYWLLSFAGGYREEEIPSSISNLEVKLFIADNTAGSPCGNVGHCQLLSIFTQALANLTHVIFAKAFF